HRHSTEGQAGTTELWGLNYTDSDQGEALANRLAEHRLWQNHRLRITTTCRTLRPGSRFELTHHPDRSGFYQVISVRLSGSQKSLAQGQSGKAFQCEVEAIPVSLSYRPAYQPLPARSHLLTGHITREVDELGRYRIQYPFDRRLDDNAEPSPATELMQPFGGADHGMHFPLEAGTEVAIGSINGDLDRPVILGALYNARSPNVVTAENARQNRIRTRAGNELLLHDQRGEEHIQLNTPDALNRLKLDATADQHQIELFTEEGDMTLSAGQNMNLTVGKSMTVEVGEDHHLEVGGDQSLVTDEGNIQLEAGADVNLSAEGDLHWQAQNGQLNVFATGNMQFETQSERFDQITGGDYQISVEQGPYHLEASGPVVLNSGKRISLSVSDSQLQMDSRQLVIDTRTVDINADKIAIRAGTVGNN
ncbi:MAG: phage baseplate assembly protein V, partial [Saccharospirillum sp.]|nr:phage baseplate assembly protein V [Saccharospirillum sp.]